ncbi:APC membrane recruitment protein 2-like [Scleropages formosus]|uniref:APC membrane recruitment protein 2-like n=1 Tax=Scleropages formosus TaxID=113540 RepID=A0A8C9RPW9_SCLFO|nr:APC membrane recruitment protein 2-like [Scleropages formosus]
MDVQSESNEPPACEPPPPSRINKAAFKLFGRRKPGSAVPAIFSMRGKGEGSKAAAKAPLVRSKTHDGLAEGGHGEQGAPEEPTEAPCEAAPLPPPPSRPSISSVASVKSLGFLTLLRGGSRRGSSVSRRGGLRGLLGNVRWPRRARGPEDRRDEAPPPSDVLLASRSNSVEIVKEHMTLTPRPPPRTLDTTPMDSGMPIEGQRRSGLQSARPLSMATSPGSPPAVPCMDLLSSVLADISSLGSFDSPAASGDITSDAKTQVLRAGTSTEQDRGQVTRPADAPALGEEAHSSTDEVSEDGEAGSCKLDLQKDFHSPSLSRSPLPETGSALRPEKKLPPVSKIPVSGSGRPGKTPRDAAPDKGHLDLGTPIATPSSTPAATPVVTPAVTPGPEDECAGFTAQWNSSRGDVHHPNVDPAEVLELSSKLTPPTRAPGAARTTRIPVKQTQLVQSTRQGALIQPYPPQAKTEAPRTKIPVSKVPVRRGSNKPPTTHQSPHDLPRK